MARHRTSIKAAGIGSLSPNPRDRTLTFTTYTHMGDNKLKAAENRNVDVTMDVNDAAFLLSGMVQLYGGDAIRAAVSAVESAVWVIIPSKELSGEKR